MQLKAHCSYLGHTGYNYHSRGFFRALAKRNALSVRNFSVDPNPTYLTEQDRQILTEQTWFVDNVRKDFKFSDKRFPANQPLTCINIVLNTVNHYQFYDPYKGPKAAFTVWETTRYPDEFFKTLLDFDQLWVPSSWAWQCAVQQGYPATRVHVVPEAIDDDILAMPAVVGMTGQKFRVTIVGRWEYRKSTLEMIQAFHAAFEDDADVELVLNIDNPFSVGKLSTEDRLKKQEINDPRIKVVRMLPRPDYLRLLQQSNVVMMASRGEGWGIPALEAAALGTPTIVTNYGAPLEYAHGWPLLCDIDGTEPANICDEYRNLPGEWCKPNFKHLVELLHTVKDTYDAQASIAVDIAASLRAKFTWDAAAAKAVQAIKSAGWELDSKEATSNAGIIRHCKQSNEQVEALKTVAVKPGVIELPSDPEFTVILLSHDKPLFVRQAINSVLTQTYDRWTCTVIDSGVLFDQGFFKEFDDPRLSVIRSSETEALRKERLVTTWCYNNALAIDDQLGDYILLLTDDTVLFPWALRATALDFQRGAQAIYTSMFLGESGGDTVTRLMGERAVAGIKRAGHLDRQLDQSQFFFARTLLPELRKKFGREVMPEDLNLLDHADGVFMERVAELTPVVPVPVFTGWTRRTPHCKFGSEATRHPLPMPMVDETDPPIKWHPELPPIFITGGNPVYQDIILKLVKSIELFSKLPMAIWAVNGRQLNGLITPHENVVEVIDVTWPVDAPRDVFYWKQRICIEAIQRYPNRRLIWIDGDAVVGPRIDTVIEHFAELENYPLADQHILKNYFTHWKEMEKIVWETSYNDELCELVGVPKQITTLAHTCLFLFDHRSQWFFQETLDVYAKLKADGNDKVLWWNDEGIDNMLRWKHGLRRFLPLSNFESGFNPDRVFDFFSRGGPHDFNDPFGWNFIPEDKSKILYLHGNKDPKHADTLIDLWLGRCGPNVNVFIDASGPPVGMSRLNLTGHVTEVAKQHGWPAANYYEIFVLHDYDNHPAMQIKPGDVVIDVGGCIGLFSMYAHRKGASRVLTFEPDSRYFDVLRRNVQQDQPWDVYKCAVLDHTGHVNFNLTNHFGGSRVEPSKDRVRDEMVSCKTLDKILDPLKRVDLLKIDVEGAEHRVLAGLSDESATKVRRISMEYHHVHFGFDEVRRRELIERFHALGFQSYLLFLGDNNHLQMIYFWRS